MDDELLVEYNDGSRRFVTGAFLFLVKNDAFNWIEIKKQDELKDIDFRIYQLQEAREKVLRTYANVNLEDRLIFN